MPEIISNDTIPHPHGMTNLLTDSYTNRNVLQKIEENRHLRLTKFPSLRGRYGFDSSEVNVNVKSDFTKWNDEGEMQPVAPHRIYDSVIDPTSGFVSAGCDHVGGQAGNTQVESMVQLNRTPQSIIPSVQSTRQKVQAVPPDFKRLGTWCPGTPTAWNSRKTLDVWIRAKLGGWTSDVDPRKAKDFNKRPQTSVMREPTENIQHKLALKYMYGTSTQRGYEDVPWDILLRPKQWPPALAVAEQPDIVLYRRNMNTKCRSAQAGGGGSEMFLSRYPHNKGRQITRVDLANQIQLSPLYSGHIKTENLEESIEKFDPYSRKISSATDQGKPVQLVSLDKPLSSSEYGRKSRISKKVTFGPSYSPFNTVEKVTAHT